MREAETVSIVVLADERADAPPALVVAYRRQAPRDARRDENGEDGVTSQGP